MKKMVLLVQDALLIALLATCGHPLGAQNSPLATQKAQVVFAAKPAKGAYAKGEAVEFDFGLKNGGNDPIIVPRALRLSLNVDLEISNAAGTLAKWCGRIADQLIPSRSRYQSLSPGQSVRARLTVSCVDKDNPNRAWGYSLDAPGKYTIRARYRLPQPKEFFESLFPKQDVARGPIFAEPVTIEVR